MKAGFELTTVLVTVLTYPHPSTKHQETVCTAGITDAGEWVRLYPVDYRYLPRDKQYRKWQWIEVALAPRGHGANMRAESRKPDLSTLRILGEPLPTRDRWRQRRAVIDRMPHHTLRQLEGLYEARRISLGIVRPMRVLDLEAEPVSRQWPPKYQALWSQLRLFGERKKLRKLPYRFRYVFRCEDTDEPHRKMNEDWELGVLFLKELERKGSEAAAIQSIRAKFLDEMCRADKDTRLFMGTRHPYNEWLVLGTFWPPKDAQSTLFPAP